MLNHFPTLIEAHFCRRWEHYTENQDQLLSGSGHFCQVFLAWLFFRLASKNLFLPKNTVNNKFRTNLRNVNKTTFFLFKTTWISRYIYHLLKYINDISICEICTVLIVFHRLMMFCISLKNKKTCAFIGLSFPQNNR